MVFGNTGETSGSGVAFTRNPANGTNEFYGEFLVNAQGEDVVAGVRTPEPVIKLKDVMPKSYAELLKVRATLEKHFKDVQDIEFTVQEGKLFMLQTRNGKRTAAAGLKCAADMVREKLIDWETAVLRNPADQLEQLRYSLDAAISRFLRRGLVRAGSSLEDAPDTTTDTSTDNASSNASAGASEDATQAGSGGLPPERWKLTNRLKGRLGLLGVFYKRDPSRFLRNLSEREREELLHSLERTYRDLLISYFRDPAVDNQALESFVHTAFFSDLPITKTVEIHMNLMDGFWKQLKLEGHKNDFLQDYRLALLDVMAHLCEMYRRSVPLDAPLVDAPLVAPPGP
jgi:hypothetical protein